MGLRRLGLQLGRRWRQRHLQQQHLHQPDGHQPHHQQLQRLPSLGPNGGGYHPGTHTHYGPNGAYHPNGYYGPNGAFHHDVPGSNPADQPNGGNNGNHGLIGGNGGVQQSAANAGDHQQPGYRPGTDTHYGPNGADHPNGYYGPNGAFHHDVPGKQSRGPTQRRQQRQPWSDRRQRRRAQHGRQSRPQLRTSQPATLLHERQRQSRPPGGQSRADQHARRCAAAPSSAAPEQPRRPWTRTLGNANPLSQRKERSCKRTARIH